MGKTIAGMYTQLEGKELIRMLSGKLLENTLVINEREKSNEEITTYMNNLEPPKTIYIKCVDDGAFFEFIENTEEWFCPNCEFKVELREL